MSKLQKIKKNKKQQKQTNKKQTASSKVNVTLFEQLLNYIITLFELFLSDIFLFKVSELTKN